MLTTIFFSKDKDKKTFKENDWFVMTSFWLNLWAGFELWGERGATGEQQPSGAIK